MHVKMTDDDVDNMTQNAIMNMFPCILATHIVSYECSYILSYRKAPCSFLKKYETICCFIICFCSEEESLSVSWILIIFFNCFFSLPSPRLSWLKQNQFTPLFSLEVSKRTSKSKYRVCAAGTTY